MFSTDANSPSSTFLIQTEDGKQYSFGIGPDALERTFSTPDAPTACVTTAWHLTSITSADGNDQISINYRSYSALNFTSAANAIQQVKLSAPGAAAMECASTGAQDPSVDDEFIRSPVRHVTSLPTRIESASTLLTFYAGTNRLDIDSSDARIPRLDSLVWVDKLSGQRRAFYFTYSYFKTSNPRLTPTGDTMALDMRLKLLRVGEAGRPPHAFFYNALQLPGRDSKSRDHWNFFNNEINTTLVPVLSTAAAQLFPNSTSQTAAVRASKAPFAQACVLEKVVYPTGGNTQFFYEPNSVKSQATDDFFGEPAHLVGSQLTATSAVTPGATFPGEPEWEALNAYYYNGSSGSGGGQLPRSTTNNGPWLHARLIHLPTGARNASVSATVRLQDVQRPMTQPSSAYLIKLCYVPNAGYLTNLTNLVTPFVVGDQPSAASHDVNAGLAKTTRYDISGFTDQCIPQPVTDLDSGYYMLYTLLRHSEGSISATLTYTPNYQAPRNRVVGGLRLRQVVDEPLIGPATRTTYNYNAPALTGDSLTQYSSGRLFVEPRYAQTTYCGNLIVTAYDQIAVGYLYDGYHIGYQYVTETKEGATNGYTRYEYLNGATVGGLAQYHNLVFEQTDYTTAGVRVHQVTNQYDGFNDDPPIQAAQVGLWRTYPSSQFGASADYCFPEYRISSAFLGPVEKRERYYDPTGLLTLQTLTRYRYGPTAFGRHHTTPTEVRQVLSPGDTLVVASRYPTDYDTTAISGGVATGIRSLLRKHVFSAPIEQVRFRKGVTGLVTHGQCYRYVGVKPSAMQELEVAAPLSLTTYVSSTIRNGTFAQDPHYRTTWLYDRYSPMGNILQRHQPGQGFTSFVWGYGETTPIAEAQNTAVEAVAFTSFEPEAAGNWQYATGGVVSNTTHFTGKAIYELDGWPGREVSKPGLPAGDYELLLWSHGANVPQVSGASQQRREQVAQAGNWRQHRFHLTMPANGTVRLNSATPGLLIWIDEVRLHPVTAQMTSYTHAPLRGMTSQTDATGRTTTYEYDRLGRLVRTRDEQGRILTQQEYHYARP